MVEPHEQVFVSLQDRDADDDACGHRGVGVLLEPDLVAMRHVPRGLIDGSLDAEVLVTFVPPRPGTVSRSIPKLVWLSKPVPAESKTPPADLIVFLTLPVDTGLPPFLERDLTLADVEAALAASPDDPWIGLEGAGIVPRDLPANPPAGLFAALPDVEAEQRRLRVDTTQKNNPSWSICHIIGRCLLPSEAAERRTQNG